jgi:hypothetical protein
MPVSSVFGARPLVKGGGAVSSEKSRALIVSVTVVTQRISLVAPDTSNHDKENVMPRLKQVFSLILAASTLVMSAHTEAAIIYDITNATSVQNGYSLSGSIEVSGTGNDVSLSSFNLTATKADNPTLTFSSALGDFAGGGNLIATNSGFYVPVGGTLQISGSGMSQSLNWLNDWFGDTFYSAATNITPVTVFWNSGSYPITDGNSWQIGSVQGAPSSVPEIDPNSLGSVLALVLGSLGLLERRRLKAA